MNILFALAIAIPTATNSNATTMVAPTIELTYPATVTDSVTGPVYVMFTESRRRDPSQGPDWFSPEPFYRVDVTDWAPGEVLSLGPDTAGYPTPLGELESGRWRVQAVMRTDLDTASIAGGDAVLSEIKMVHHGEAEAWPLALSIDEVSLRSEPYQPEGTAVLSQRSELLSNFYGRDIDMRAVAFFPKAFDAEADRNWPVLYVIGGFAGSLDEAPFAQMMWGDPERNQDYVVVYLEGECGSGHHVFADSANNGPRGQALVEEFIPWLESKYPLVQSPDGRLLTGHSSGGWSSLWLQVTYPEFFGGTWSTAPDPVNFHAFQQIDIYADGANAYHQADGTRIAVARNRRGKPRLFMDDFCAMEEAIGDGGQIRSFEWVFSPRGDDGRPRPLFDRTTGDIDPEVAEAWKAYDIAYILQENWETLGPKLQGKIHVYMGDADTFYLDGATRLLKAQMAELKTDAVVTIIPGDHSSILFGKLRNTIRDDMVTTLNSEAQPVAESSGRAID
ncbi:MAG: alpha/beta hydrolase-fold protein [Planctomycetota bacterium]|nr:alpha/beta hydrolase-fold protein [Planctomycetota bacterium]